MSKTTDGTDLGQAPKPKGPARGPKAEWGDWRRKRCDRIAKPHRNKAALALTQPKGAK